MTHSSFSSILSVQTLIRIDLSLGAEIIIGLTFSFWRIFCVWDKAVVQPGLFLKVAVFDTTWQQNTHSFFLECIPLKFSIPILSYLFDRKRTQRRKEEYYDLLSYESQHLFLFVFFNSQEHDGDLCIYSLCKYMGFFEARCSHLPGERGKLS